jgi:hypothetical protein
LESKSSYSAVSEEDIKLTSHDENSKGKSKATIKTSWNNQNKYCLAEKKQITPSSKDRTIYFISA